MERQDRLDCIGAVKEHDNDLRDLRVIREGYIIKSYHKVLSKLVREFIYCGLTCLYGQDAVEKDIETVSNLVRAMTR